MSRKGKQRHQRYMRQHCALCGQKGNTLVLGPTGCGVCHACLAAAGKIAGMKPPKKQEPVSSEILTPQEILKELNRTIIGQDEAKNAISIALWKQQLKSHGMKSVPRSTLLLHGPTGCGKTAIVKEAVRIAGLPFIHFDATSLSEAGYKGRDAADMVKDLVKAFEDHPHLAHGVIFIDEMDKLAAKGSEQRAAYSRGTQHSLLRLIEGTEIRVDGKVIHTEDLLFIFGGAFSGIGPQVEHRNPIGFSAQPTEEYPHSIDAEDFIAYGMEPELMGRITQRVELEPLSRDDLRRILLNAENSVLHQYQQFFAEQGIELQVSSKRVEELLDEAVATDSGARGLQTAVENMVQPMLFRLAEKHVESKEWIA